MPADAKAFMKVWEDYLAAPDPKVLDGLIADEPTFKSPAFFKPKVGKPYLTAILGAVNSGMEEFTYTRKWTHDNAVLFEFTAKLGDIGMKGIDIITLDDDNRITELEVLIRPLNALQAMAQHVMASFQKDAAAE